MKKTNLKNNIFIVAKRSDKQYRKLDFYMMFPSGEQKYMFTRDFTKTCYDACKSGLPLNSILYARKKNHAFMGLVKYLRFMMPYLIEYFGLDQGGDSDNVCWG